MSSEFETLRKFYLREAGIDTRRRYWKKMREYFYWTVAACVLIAAVAWAVRH